jgi:hypothetical protein
MAPGTSPSGTEAAAMKPPIASPAKPTPVIRITVTVH